MFHADTFDAYAVPGQLWDCKTDVYLFLWLIGVVNTLKKHTPDSVINEGRVMTGKAAS